MKRVKDFMIVVIAVSAVLFLTAQTVSLVQELNNDYTMRKSLTNALIANQIGVSAFVTTGTLDTVYIPGLRSTSIMATALTSATAGALPTSAKDLIFYTYQNDDTAIFTRAAAGTSGQKFYYFPIKW